MKQKKITVNDKIIMIGSPRFNLFTKITDKYPEVSHKQLDSLVRNLNNGKMKIGDFVKLLHKYPHIFMMHFERVNKKVNFFKRGLFWIVEKLFIINNIP